MYALANVLIRTRKNTQLATREMGKVIGQSRKEIEKCALVCRYYAENAATLLADEDVKTEATKVILPSTHWSNFGGNAMELSILSSYSLCYSIINGETQEF
jgi:acyl-CoA reductase-like NAD-dependent aldehyde dehydrogenase